MSSDGIRFEGSVDIEVEGIGKVTTADCISQAGQWVGYAIATVPHEKQRQLIDLLYQQFLKIIDDYEEKQFRSIVEDEPTGEEKSC